MKFVHAPSTKEVPDTAIKWWRVRPIVAALSVCLLYAELRMAAAGHAGIVLELVAIGADPEAYLRLLKPLNSNI